MQVAQGHAAAFPAVSVSSHIRSQSAHFGAEFGTIMAPSWHHHGTSTFSSESQFCGCEYCANMDKFRRFTSCHVLIHRVYCWLGAAGLSASNLSWTLAKAYPGPESKWPCLNEASEAFGWKQKDIERSCRFHGMFIYDIQMEGFHMFSSVWFQHVLTCSDHAEQDTQRGISQQCLAIS